MIHSDAPTYHLPLPAEVAWEAELARLAYDALATTYGDSLHGIMSVICAEALQAGPVSKERQDRQRILTWRLDGDISDERFDYGVRAAATVAVASRKTDPPPADALLPQLFTPDRKKWNQTARGIGGAGLYLLGIEVRQVDLMAMRSNETALDAINYAQFEHEFPMGRRRYKANPQAGRAVTVEPLPSFGEMTAEAFDRFGMRLAQHALADYRIDFGAALQADRAAGPDRHIDNLPAYAAATRGVESASARIARLGRALYAADATQPSKQLVAELMDPDIHETAAWALLNKAPYHAAARATGYDVLLTNRLAWVRAVTKEFQPAMSVGIAMRGDVFETELERELARVAAIATTAGQLQVLLSPPQTVGVANDRAWDVYAR